MELLVGLPHEGGICLTCRTLLSRKMMVNSSGDCPVPQAVPRDIQKWRVIIYSSCIRKNLMWQTIWTNFLYSRGQAKPTNLLSWQGVHLGLRFFQILVQIIEMSRKTHLRSFSYDILGWPIFWDPNLKKFVRQKPSLDGFGSYKCTYRLRTIENGIQMHHGSPWGTAMTFFLAYSPLCSLSYESHTVCWHPSPRAVDELPDHLSRTHVESIFSSI